VAGGDRLLALAYQERRSRYDPHHVETRAERAGGGCRLTGEKIQVLDGHVANILVISARTSGQARDPAGITLFLLPRDAPGVRVERQWRIDARAAALVGLDGARVGPEAVLGGVDSGATLLARVLDRATIGLTADMQGGIGMTDEHDIGFYLKAARAAEIMFGDAAYHRDRVARLDGY